MLYASNRNPPTCSHFVRVSEGTRTPDRLDHKPRVGEGDPDIHFLEPEEVEALLRGVPDNDLGRVERRMYLAATMTGMRQGELLALRWRDIDWPARRVRIRRNFVRGEFGTPKSKRSSRSIPLADRLAGELDRLYQETPYRHDDDLVFAHPHTGKPIDGSVRPGSGCAHGPGAYGGGRRQMTRQEPPPGYKIEFFRGADGSEPARRFIDSLSKDKRDALVAALRQILARHGLDVCRSEWGKQLGSGLAEFRIRHDQREVLAREGITEPDLPESSPEKILLRVFFHAHGKRLVLLLSGYDKGTRPNPRHQQREIERARTHLKEWQAQQSRERRSRRGGSERHRGGR